MDINHDDEAAFYMSDWSGSITPPLSDAEEEFPVSQCVVPVRKDTDINAPGMQEGKY